MPIVVQHQPAGLIGDLASNAGNFATGQAQQQMGIQQGAQALQYQQAAAQNQYRNDSLDLQNRHLDIQQQYNQQRGANQFLLDQQKAQERQDQIDQTYGYKGQQQRQRLDFQGGQGDLSRASREGIASDRTDLGYYVADQRNDASRYRTDMGYQNNQDKIEAAKQRWSQMANPQDALAYKMQQEQRIAGDRQASLENQGRTYELKQLDHQAANIDRQLNNPNLVLSMSPDEVDALRAQRKAIDLQHTQKMNEYQNFYMGRQAQPQQQPMGSLNFNPAQNSLDNRQPMPYEAVQPNEPAVQPAPIAQAPQPMGLGEVHSQGIAPNPQVTNAIRQMAAQGMSREQIKAALAQQYGIQ